MPSLLTRRAVLACCVVRGALVVLGGATPSGGFTSSVEILSEGEGAFKELPPLSCGDMTDAAAVAVEASEGAARQVLMLGGYTENLAPVSLVHLVDLATGVCTPQPSLRRARDTFAAARLPNGSVVCAGGSAAEDWILSSVEVLEPAAQGTLDAAWTWRESPAMSVRRYGCRGCVLSDGRFAVLGGTSDYSQPLLSCETLTVGDGEHWEAMPPMRDARMFFACAAVAGCVIVAGGRGLKSAEVFDEVLNRWLRLPCDIPFVDQLYTMGSGML